MQEGRPPTVVIRWVYGAVIRQLAGGYKASSAMLSGRLRVAIRYVQGSDALSFGPFQGRFPWTASDSVEMPTQPHRRPPLKSQVP